MRECSHSVPMKECASGQKPDFRAVAAISPDPKKPGNFGKVDFQAAKSPIDSMTYPDFLKVIIG